jgi:hypothetical protein
MASSEYQTLCHVRLPVSDISKSLLHSLVNRQAICGTADHCSFFIVSCVVSKHSCPISTSLLHSLIFLCTNIFYVNTHTEHISIYPALSGTEATIKLFPHCSHLNNIHSTVPPAVSVATPQSLCSQNNTKWLTCFHALQKDNFRKEVILLLRSAVLSRYIGSCG